MSLEIAEDRVVIVFQPHGRRNVFRKGINLLEAAKRLGVDISSLCGGRGLCGKCKVKILRGYDYLNPLRETEIRFLTDEEIREKYRLACLTSVTTPCETIIYIPERSRVGRQRLQIEGFEVSVKPNPLVKKYLVELSPPTLRDPRPDDQRLLDSLREKYGVENIDIHYELLSDLPIILRESKWRVTATIWGDKVIAVEPGDTTSRCFGFACDIGSTKLAGFLMDLNTGKVVSVAARINPQIQYGEDIISRITHVLLKGWNGLNDLQKAVVKGINEIIDECCQKANVKPEEIYETVFVGNTAMMMFLLKIWPQYVAYSPYPPPRSASIDLPSRIVGIRTHSRANLHYLPTIGGFVGADNVANMVVTKLPDSNDIGMCIDIGTNTEIGIGNREIGVWYDSCASGPAFEGMTVKHGMRATSGSIERISIDIETLEPIYKTIDDEPPIGICGSGLVDILAEMLKSGIIDMSGRFNPEYSKINKRIREGPDGWEYVVAYKEETGGKLDIDIVITQKDVRELQKAKAAIHTGASLIMKRLGITENDIKILYVAGAFGNYIDPENARTIGMYPEIPIERIKFIGNAAGTGARMCLISKEEREYAKYIVKNKIKYFELAADPEFQIEYINSTFLPYRDLSKYPITANLLKRLRKSS
ncbi:MAG: ASKHA domain-containing protein [Candidatus Methanomethylicia archaeon]